MSDSCLHCETTHTVCLFTSCLVNCKHLRRILLIQKPWQTGRKTASSSDQMFSIPLFLHQLFYFLFFLVDVARQTSCSCHEVRRQLTDSRPSSLPTHGHCDTLQHRITYKLCLLMHLVHNNRAPSYLVNSVTATASLSYRGRLRSASSQRYEQPRTRLKFGERCFAFAGPAAWNSLPSSVQELTDTTAFKHQLKTVLFQRCYSSSPSFN